MMVRIRSILVRKLTVADSQLRRSVFAGGQFKYFCITNIIILFDQSD